MALQLIHRAGISVLHDSSYDCIIVILIWNKYILWKLSDCCHQYSLHAWQLRPHLHLYEIQLTGRAASVMHGMSSQMAMALRSFVIAQRLQYAC